MWGGKTVTTFECGLGAAAVALGVLRAGTAEQEAADVVGVVELLVDVDLLTEQQLGLAVPTCHHGLHLLKSQVPTSNHNPQLHTDKAIKHSSNFHLPKEDR